MFPSLILNLVSPFLASQLLLQTRKSKVEPLSLQLIFTWPYLSHYIGPSKFSTLLCYRLFYYMYLYGIDLVLI